MDADWIITVFVVIDDMLQNYEHQTDCRARVSDSEVLTLAVCAAKFCQNHHVYQCLLAIKVLYYP